MAVVQHLPLWDQQRQRAETNAKLLAWAWGIIFSLSALLQMLLWPEPANVACVLMAWAACLATGLAILRSRVTMFYPWSSLLVLTFCLQECGLPLVLMLLQGDPLINNLEVPQATYFHLLMCQAVLLVVHTGYRVFRIGDTVQKCFRQHVLQPLGFFSPLRLVETMIFGAIGLLAAVYIYVIVRAEQGGEIAATGPVLERMANGLIPFAYIPFLLLLPRILSPSIANNTRRWIIPSLFFMLIACVAAAYNSRSVVYLGVAMLAIGNVLMVMTGYTEIVIGRYIYIGAVGIVLVVTVGSDVAIAMRVARDDRVNKSSRELIRETIEVMTTDRSRLKPLRRGMADGEDSSEAWYVTNPLLSRVVNTHFQDRALAIGLYMDTETKSTLGQVELEHLLCAFPNPLLQMLGISLNKDEVNAQSIGDWMLFCGGKKETLVRDGHATGGFIGDGYALFGWTYLVAFGFLALIYFLFSDSLYNSPISRVPAEMEHSSPFAIVALVNGYGLAMALTNESLSGLFGYVIRQPLQWLVLFGGLLAVIRFLSWMIFHWHPTGGKIGR